MRTRFGVASYFVSACLGRAADAGAIVGIVLLAHRIAPHSALGGLLAACLTAPHLAGPFAARLLDRTTRRALFLACAFVLYGVALSGGAFLLSLHLFGPAAVALAVAGACGPLVTGGLSSVLAVLITARESAQRRAQAMDAFTYAVAATGGPALIAVVSAVGRPLAAVVTAAALAVVAAATLLLLPAAVNARAGSRVPALTVRQAIGVLVRTPALRRVAVGTALSAAPIGALSLLALGVALDHGGSPVQGAVLVTADGVGGLAGSAIAMLHPLRGNPETLTRWWTVIVALAFTLCASSGNLPVAAVAFFITGAATSVQFAARLAARSAYSPPPARAQVFVTMAGLKVAFSSIGVALVGLVAVLGSLWLLLASAIVVLLGASYMFADRLRSVNR